MNHRSGPSSRSDIVRFAKVVQDAKIPLQD